MNMNEAMELAATVESHRPRLRVVAIGRFKMAGDIDDTTPWGVSITEDNGRPFVVWSEAELRPVLERLRPAAPAAKTKRRKTDAEIGLSQPALF